MKAKYHHFLYLFVSILYALILIALLFFKDHIRGINYVPFRFIHDYVILRNPLGVSNIIGNTLLFAPLGILISMKGSNVGKTIVFMLTAIFGAELIQYVFCCGISDIDDILLNMIGGISGIGLYHAVKNSVSDFWILLLILLLSIGLVLVLIALHFGLFGIRIRIF